MWTWIINKFPLSYALTRHFPSLFTLYFELQFLSIYAILAYFSVILVIHKKFITSQIFFYRWYHHAIEILCPALFFCFIYYHQSVFHVRTRKSFVAEWFAQPLIKCGMTVLIFLYLKKIIEIKMYGLQLFPGA